MVPIRDIRANRNNHGGFRGAVAIKYIVIHYTGNDGDTAENNGKYFQRDLKAEKLNVASAHYFVDDKEIIRSVPDNHIAYSVEGTNYGGRLHGIANNANTLNIELCDTVKNGTIAPTKKTIDNALELVRAKIKEHNIPQENVIRHYDITKKACPAYWVNDERWRAEFWNRITENAPIEFTPITPEDRAVYRMYNKNSGEHFFTDNAGEGNNLLSLGWLYEGIAWYFTENADTPIYRLYNPWIGEHVFTDNDLERGILAGYGWIDEGTAFLSGGDNPVYRLYDTEARHLYTASWEEKELLQSKGWKYEGIGWYCA